MNKNVFIIDEEDFFANLIKRKLTKDGFSCQVFTSGQELVDRILTEEPLIIFTEMVLPDISGIELIKKIRQISSRLTIVIITANADKDNVVEAINSNADYLIKKPFELNEISAVTERFRRRRNIEDGRKKIHPYIKNDLNIKFPGKRNFITASVSFVRELFYSIGYYNETEINKVATAFYEGLANAFMHGNNNDETQEIHLSVLYDNDELDFYIRDNGSGFDFNKKIGEMNDPKKLLVLGGRGITIIDSFMDGYEFLDNGSTLHMTKHL